MFDKELAMNQPRTPDEMEFLMIDREAEMLASALNSSGLEPLSMPQEVISGMINLLSKLVEMGKSMPPAKMGDILMAQALKRVKYHRDEVIPTLEKFRAVKITAREEFTRHPSIQAALDWSKSGRASKKETPTA